MGRRQKPDELKTLQGNPGKRRLPKPEAEAAPGVAPAATAAALEPPAPFEIPDFLTHAREREIFARVVEDYLRRRVARRQDVIAYARWAHYVHRWIKCKEQLGDGGTWYETKSKHGDMLRMHPAAKEQLQLERVLQSLEDRLGLNPVARQNVLRGLSALPSALGGLFDEKPKEAPAKPDAGETEPPKQSTPLGYLQLAGVGAKPH